jgi:O-antigen ligase
MQVIRKFGSGEPQHLNKASEYKKYKPSPLLLALPVRIYLFTVILPVHFFIGSIQMTPVRIYFLIMLPFLILRLITGKMGKILAVDIFFVLHIAWVVLSFYVNSPNNMAYAGATALELLGGYFLARAYVRSAEQFLALIRLMFLVVCFTVPFALYEGLTNHPIIIETIVKIPGIRSEYIASGDPRMGLHRAQVVFAHPIHYGLFCSLAFSFALLTFKDIYSGITRALIGSIVAFGVFLSLSSGALLSIIIQFLLISYGWAFKGIRFRWFLLILICVFLYVLIDIASNRTPLQVFMSYATFNAGTAYYRSIIFEWGIKNVWANPILGLGLNDWVRPSFMVSSSVDNFWLLMAMRYGIPGFLLLLAGFFVGTFQIGFRKFGKLGLLSQIRQGWMITFLGLFFTLSTVHIWASIYSFVFFLFGCGLWLTQIEILSHSEIGNSNPIDPLKRRKVGLNLSGFEKSEKSSASGGNLDFLSKEADQPRYSRFPRSGSTLSDEAN